jgi:hypothetical protein
MSLHIIKTEKNIIILHDLEVHYVDKSSPLDLVMNQCNLVTPSLSLLRLVFIFHLFMHRVPKFSSKLSESNLHFSFSPSHPSGFNDLHINNIM